MFTPGTFISTARGQRPIEQLRRGDRVVTRDNGLKRIKWLGRRDISYDELDTDRTLRPVLIKTGALGGGRPERDMLVSQRHRFSVSADGALRSARAMLDYNRIAPAPALGVSYLYLLCNTQEVILANGAWAECYHPDDASLFRDGEGQRAETLKLFPEVATMGAARRITPARQIKAERSRFET